MPVKKSSREILDTIIIGAGIAGITAAIYASRKRMRFALISQNMGGQMMESAEILNYPGFARITGGELASSLGRQMKFNNVSAKQESAGKIRKDGANFRVTTEKQEYISRTAIIATGARPSELNVPGERDYRNRGVTYCAICDGPLFAGADVAVIGGGNAALEAVDFLSGIARKIYVLNIKKEFTAHEYLQENARNNKKVEIISSARTTEIKGNGKNVTSITYERAGKSREIKVEGIFVEIGRVPNTDFAEGLVKLDEHRHIVIDCSCATSVPGVFAAGDCASGHEYQYVIAAGQGCMALIKAARYLASKKGLK